MVLAVTLVKAGAQSSALKTAGSRARVVAVVEALPTLEEALDYLVSVQTASKAMIPGSIHFVQLTGVLEACSMAILHMAVEAA